MEHKATGVAEIAWAKYIEREESSWEILREHLQLRGMWRKRSMKHTRGIFAKPDPKHEQVGWKPYSSCIEFYLLKIILGKGELNSTTSSEVKGQQI